MSDGVRRRLQMRLLRIPERAEREIGRCVVRALDGFPNRFTVRLQEDPEAAESDPMLAAQAAQFIIDASKTEAIEEAAERTVGR